MSGTASVSTQFQNAVTATGLQLDQNFSTVVAYLNDPTNRNNFGVSSGSGTYAVTISPPPGGYTAGLEITFQAGNTNTAAVALNVNGLGVVSMLNQDSSALTVSQIIANGVYKSVYNGTNFIFQTPNISAIAAVSAAIPIVATQAQMETATALNVFVSPGRTQFHPGVAKAWGFFNGDATGTISPVSSYNISQIVRVGLGTYSIAVITPFSGANFTFLSFPTATNTVALSQFGSALDSTSYVVVYATCTGAVRQNAGTVNFVMYGDQ